MVQSKKLQGVLVLFVFVSMIALVYFFAGAFPEKTTVRILQNGIKFISVTNTPPEVFQDDVVGFDNNGNLAFLGKKAWEFWRPNNPVALLWGLKIVDSASIDGLLKGKTLKCQVLQRLEKIPIVDCSTTESPYVDGRIFEKSLFVSLVDLGWAVPFCDPKRHTLVWVGRMSKTEELSFSCAEGFYPWRGRDLLIERHVGL